MDKNKLSIYLIKSEFEEFGDIIGSYSNSQTIDNIGTVYLGTSHITQPKWATSFLTSLVNSELLFVSNARAVLLVKISVADGQRVFAVVMGYGKNMLKDDVIEERFGLKVVLNTINPDSLRRINKRNIGGNQKLSDEQLPLKAGINDFGIDINRDLIGLITGVSDDNDYAQGMITGGDLLSLTAEVDITNIADFLQKTYNKYLDETYKRNFAWIDQIQEVKDSRTIESLNNELILKINANDDCIYTAVPEVIEWSEIRGFKYYGRDIQDDIFVDKIRESLREPLSSFEQLKNKKVAAISSIDDSERFVWSASKCLFGELMFDDKAYCINNGKWYCLDIGFVNQINTEYASTAVSSIQFDDYNDTYTNENIYNEAFVRAHAGEYVLLDSENIPYGGGHSKIELCDILSNQLDLIHVKRYSGSSTLSHLFNQAAVSTELLVSDSNFLNIANTKILEISGNDSFCINDSRNIKIVIAIISKESVELPNIPFFSKVAFSNLKRLLNGFRLEVSICSIHNTKS